MCYGKLSKCYSYPNITRFFESLIGRIMIKMIICSSRFKDGFDTLILSVTA